MDKRKKRLMHQVAKGELTMKEAETLMKEDKVVQNGPKPKKKVSKTHKRTKSIKLREDK